MFGVGPQEMLIVGLLCLVVFGPRKSLEMARQCGRFARKARASWDELRSDLAPEVRHDHEPGKERHDRESAVNGGNPEAIPGRTVSETDGAKRGPR